MRYNNVSIVKRSTHFAVYKGEVLMGVAGTLAGAWDIAKVIV